MKNVGFTCFRHWSTKYTYKVTVITQQLPHNLPYISSYKLQLLLAACRFAATYIIRIVMWEWCCVIPPFVCVLCRTVP